MLEERNKNVDAATEATLGHLQKMNPGCLRKAISGSLQRIIPGRLRKATPSREVTPGRSRKASVREAEQIALKEEDIGLWAMSDE